MNYLRKCDEISGCGKTYPGDLTKCPNCGAPDAFSDSSPVNPLDYAYDIETYPNIFTCRFIHIATDTRWRFEISDRINQIKEFTEFVIALGNCGGRGVGYNNVGFDYPVVHFIMNNQWVSHVEIYDRAMAIIGAQGKAKWAYNVWESDQIFPQLDLIMIWHYNKSNPLTGTEPTSLKALEIAMRMDNVEDLPFELGVMLNDDEKEVLHTYNQHDVISTILFYVRSLGHIALRESLSEKYNVNMTNFSNTKIGGHILTSQLEKAGVQCYERIDGKRSPRQTIRHQIDLSQVIFNYINFEQPEFNRIKDYLSSKVITETKGVFNKLHASVDGLTYVFGTGGLHASIEAQTVESDEHYQIVDVDVASYYPNLAIMNKMFPAHLGKEFGAIYLDIYHQRKTFKKGTPENAALKEALNASYGNSNNVYSPLYDSFYTMQTCVNGQLLLCMLAEQLIKIPNLKMIQCNTDGVTFKCPREHMEHQRAICKWWEQLTCLELEEALYSRMFIGNVNNYIAECESGKIKRIGCYAYERADDNPGTREVVYGKDPSALIIPKAAEAALVRGEDIRTFIMNHKDDYDFILRAKVPRSSNLMMRWPEYDNTEIKLPNIIRYYISNGGGSLMKISPPTGKAGTFKRKSGISDTFYKQVIGELSNTDDPHTMSLVNSTECDTDGIPHDERIHTKNKSKHAIREMGISVGYKTTECNDIKNFDRSTINYEYYITKTEEIVNPLRKI